MSLQHKTGQRALEKDKITREMAKFASLGDCKAVEMIDKVIEGFITAMPFASAQNINMVLSVITTTASRLGARPIVEAVERYNEKAFHS
jgi:hypothetical protein